MHVTPHTTLVNFTSLIRIDWIAKKVVGDLVGNGGGDTVMIHLTPLEKYLFFITPTFAFSGERPHTPMHIQASRLCIAIDDC